MENERKWRRIRFARNLSALIEGSGLNRKQFAEKAEVPYPWLQRATTGGITRLDRRGREHLDRIARWFGLAEADRLWDRDFVVPPQWNTREARAARIAEDLRRLLVERGEEAEPLKTIIRLIGEAKEGMRADTSSGSSAAPMQIDVKGAKAPWREREEQSLSTGPIPCERLAAPSPQSDAGVWTISQKVEHANRMIQEVEAGDHAN